MRRRLLAGGAVAVAVVALAARVWRAGASAEGQWVAVEREDLVISVATTGELAAVSSQQVGPPVVWGQWEFKISSMAAEGAEVKAGDVVLELDASERRRELERRQADRDSAAEQIEKRDRELRLQGHDDALTLAEAEARLRTARLKAGRPDPLVAAREAEQARLEVQLAEEEVAFRRRLTEAREAAGAAELEALRDQLRRAQGRVERLEEAIARMRVQAPRAGTVIYVADWQGEKRKVGDTCWYADKLLEIPDLAAMLARCEVDEEASAKLAVGQPVVLRLDAHSDLEYRGRIRALGPSLQAKRSQSELKVVRVEVGLERTDRSRMRPGMRVRGEVEVGRRVGVLTVPLEAVVPGPEGAHVTRRRPWGAVQAKVELGARNATRVEVCAGLSQGDRVLVTGGRP